MDDPNKIATTTVTVVAVPVASGLTAINGSIMSGTSTILTPTFNGGSATIGTSGAGSMDTSTSATSGMGVSTGNLTSTTTYTLTVTNAAGTVTTVTTTVTVLAAIVAPNLVAMTDPSVYGSNVFGSWLLSEGTGTTTADSSGNGRTGTLYNFNGTSTSGWNLNANGNYLAFNGINNYVSFPDTGLPNAAGPRSISVTFNTSAATTQQTLMTYGETSESWGLSINNNGNLTLNSGSDSTTSLLLHFNPATGSNLFTNDATISRIVGTPTIDASTSEFGATSGYFNGSSGLVIPYSSAFNLSSGNFTIETWFKASSFAPQFILSKDTYGVNFDWCLFLESNNTIAIYSNVDWDKLYSNCAHNDN